MGTAMRVEVLSCTTEPLATVGRSGDKNDVLRSIITPHTQPLASSASGTALHHTQ